MAAPRQAAWLCVALAGLLLAACGDAQQPRAAGDAVPREAPAPEAPAAEAEGEAPFEPPPDWCGTGRTWPVPEPKGGWRIRLRPPPPVQPPGPPAEPEGEDPKDEDPKDAGDDEAGTYIPPPNWCGTPGMGLRPPPVPAWETFHLVHANGNTYDLVSQMGDQDPNLRGLLRLGWRIVGRTQGVSLRPRGR